MKKLIMAMGLLIAPVAMAEDCVPPKTDCCGPCANLNCPPPPPPPCSPVPLCEVAPKECEDTCKVCYTPCTEC